MTEPTKHDGTDDGESVIEQTEYFVSWKRHEELLSAAKSEAYKKGIEQGTFQAGNINWNGGYAKGLDVGYLTAKREIISQIKSLLDYDKETED
jgi:hypothetical protein